MAGSPRRSARQKWPVSVGAKDIMKTTVVGTLLVAALASTRTPALANVTNEVQSLTFRVYAGYTSYNEWEFCLPRTGDGTLRWGKAIDGGTTNDSFALTRIEAKVSVFEPTRTALFAEAARLPLNQLDASYGDTVVDDCTRSLMIVTPHITQTVSIAGAGLQNWALPNSGKHHELLQVLPVLRLWEIAYQQFVDPHLIAFTRSDREIIEQVEKTDSTKATREPERGQSNEGAQEDLLTADIPRIVFTIMCPLIGAVGAAALFVGGCFYFPKERARGTRLIIAGLLALFWGILRILQRLVVPHDDYRTRWAVDHVATLAAGATLVMLVLVLIEESKRKKSLSKDSPATSSPAAGGGSSANGG